MNEDQLVMVGRVVDFGSENAGEMAVSEAAQAQWGVVTGLYNQLSGSRGTVAKRTKSLTAEGKAAKTELIDFLPGLLGPLSRVATELEDNDLLASVTLTSKQLRKLRPLALLGVAGAVLGHTKRPEVAAGLAKRGLREATLQPLVTALERFRVAQPATRKTIDERTLAAGKLEELLGRLMDELRELDQEMKAFKLIDRAIYDGYQQMRKIINSGGGKNEEVKPEV